VADEEKADEEKNVTKKLLKPNGRGRERERERETERNVIIFRLKFLDILTHSNNILTDLFRQFCRF